MTPNVLVLMADQHRFDTMGCVGHPVVETPNIDRLAGEGLNFSRTYCQGPLCIPARASFLSERYVRDHGVSDFRYEIPVETPTFMHSMKAAGYHTACVGKMHFHRPEYGGRTSDKLTEMRAHGFDDVIDIMGKTEAIHVRSEYSDYLESRGLYREFREWMSSNDYYDQIIDGRTIERSPIWQPGSTPLPTEAFSDTFIGNRVVQWIDDYDRDEPFVCWAGFVGPHDPWEAPAEYVDRYRDMDIPLDTTTRPPLPSDESFRIFTDYFLNDWSQTAGMSAEVIRELRRYYYGGVTLIDDAVGRIVGALDRRGMLDNTLLIYTSDHGEMLGTHGFLTKMVFYEPSVRVPLVIRPPGGCDPAVVDGMIEHIDVPATIRAVADAPDVPDGDGRSLLGHVGDPGHAFTRDVVHSENWGFGLVATDRHKVVMDETRQVPVQFFDIEDDPDEERDLIDDPESAGILETVMEDVVRPFYAAGVFQPVGDAGFADMRRSIQELAHLAAEKTE